MACDDRQLTQAQREAAFAQQRTGVVRAVRPFSGSPTIENLIDYVNRELGPAVRDSRQAVNDVYLQVADNAPSANPLAFYFSASTAAADPTVGRIRLNASPQNTATVMRVSQSNARLVDVLPWLDVMAGGPTTPLGVVTLVDAINPARFIRWDLNTMTDQGAYWDLGITIIESSDTDPFVEDEAVVVGFISGVSAAGSTVPVGSLSPAPADTFLGNITNATAPHVDVPLASIDSTSIIYDTATHTMQRAALTGAVASAQNANTTLFAGIRDNGTAENDRTNLNHLSTTSVIAVVTDDAGNDELEITHERAALTGFAVAAQNSNATTSAEPIVTYSASANMSAERVTTSSTTVTVSTAVANQIEFQTAATTGAISQAANSNASLFAGIRDNGTAETDRTNLNFVSGDSNTAVVTDDAANDELEVTYNYVGSTTNVNLTSLTGAQGIIDITALRCGGSVTVETVSADYSIDGFTAQASGFWFWLIDRRTSGSTMGEMVEDPGATTTGIRSPGLRSAFVRAGDRALFYYTNNRWRCAPINSGAGRLIARTVYTTGSGTHTYDARTSRTVVKLRGGGGGGGGAGTADGNIGSGGGEGGYEELYITTVPTSSAYSVGAAGTAGAATPDPGTAGGTGGNTTFNDGAVTRTASGATGGAVGGVMADPGTGGAVDTIGGTVLYSCRGAPGEHGFFDTTNVSAHGGTGGGTGGGKGGFGGTAGTTSEAGAAAGTNSGGGGGGGSRPASPAVAGGAGAAGYIIVDEYT